VQPETSGRDCEGIGGAVEAVLDEETSGVNKRLMPPSAEGGPLVEYVLFDDYQRLENAAMDVCIALAKYEGGADAQIKLRDDIIEASDKILEALGVNRENWREFYESIRGR
jgi:hypothetical protein